MADQDTIIVIGSSNTAGFYANLYDVDDQSYARWFSQLKPTAATPAQAFTAAASDVITAVAHGLSNGLIVTVTSTGALPAGLTAATNYYVVQATTDTFKVSLTLGGAAVDITDAGTGVHTLTSYDPTPARPYTVQLEGTRMWTPRRPYASNHQRSVAAVDNTSPTISITYGGAAITPTPKVHQTMFILSGTGRSATNIATITAVTDPLLETGAAWTPTPAVGDTLVVLPTSHLIAVGGINAAGTTVTKTASTDDFDANDVGRYVLFLIPVDALSNSTRRIVSVDSTTQITLDAPLTGTFPPDSTGFVILDGANAVEDLASMQPPNAVLQPLTVHIDEVAPVYLTGLEYMNYDFTPFASPRNQDIPTESINSVPELSWNVRSKTARQLVALQLGVSASRLSPFKLDPVANDNLVGPLHDFLSLDYNPSSPNGIYPILTAAITSMRTLIEAEGNTMKVRGIFINLFDNDPNASYQHLYRLKANTILLRDSLRAFLGDSNIPWIMSGPYNYAGGPTHPNNEFVYDELFAIAAEDAQSGVVDTRVGYNASTIDNLHLDALAQVNLGQDYFTVWEPIHDRLLEASTAVDVSLCNRALTVIGEAPNITSLDPPEGSAHAQICATLFEDAVKTVADSRHWTFADNRASLQKVRLRLPHIVITVTQRLVETATPHGLKIGSPVTFEKAADGTGTVPAPLVAGTVYYVASAYVGPNQFAVTATVGGYGPVIFFTGVGSGLWRCFKESDRDGYAFMYALPSDCETERSVVPFGAPDDWPGMDGSLVGTPYSGTGVVATSRDGLNYSLDTGGFGSKKLIPFKRALSRGGDAVIYSSLGPADLIYSRDLSDTSLWPPLFKEAVMFQLASGLAGAIKREPKLVDWCIGKAQGYISEAARVDGHRVVDRQTQSYPWSR